LAQDAARLAEECAACGRQRHLPAVAGEQGHLQLALQPADLTAQMRLGYAEPYRRAREAQLLGDRDEKTQKAILHQNPFIHLAYQRYRDQVLDAPIACLIASPDKGALPPPCRTLRASR